LKKRNQNHEITLYNCYQWSDEDKCYLVHLPDFSSQQFHTHGDTYEDALQNAVEVLELLVEEYQLDGKSLPEPKTLVENLLFA
jgi:antitoxin HicB